MKKKKIGIITFHRADNLGAVLQAYALQSVLEEKCDADAEIINYKCSYIEGTKRLEKCNSVKDFLKGIAFNGYYFIKHRGFEKFRNKKLKISSKLYDSKNIESCGSLYDIVISGSDQVWNLECSGGDYSYFLDFVKPPTKRIAYAASIGRYIYTDADKKKIVPLLQDFTVVSVREESAADKLANIGVDQVQVQPDPVVLLSKEQWKGLVGRRLCRVKYVLVYLILEDVNVVKNAEQYANEHGYKIINNKKSLEFILHNSPLEFLSWIYYAESVFTNSFHGTVFSTIFNKLLVCDVELANGGENNRISDFLVKINAQRCIVQKKDLQVASPDAQEKLEELRISGLEYLVNNCK